MLVKSLLLDDRDGNRLIAPGHRFLKSQNKLIISAPQIRIIDRRKAVAADCRVLGIKAFQPIGYLRIDQRIVVHKAVNCQFPYAGFDRKAAGIIRIEARAVSVHIGNRRFQYTDALIGGLNIDLRDTGRPSDKKVAFVCQGTVGVGRSDTGKTVGNAIVQRFNIPVGDKIIGQCNVYAVTAEDPDFSPAVLIQVKIIGVGESVDRHELIVFRQISQRISCHDPVNIATLVFLYTHYSAGCQTALRTDVHCAGAAQNKDSAAVCPAQYVAVLSFRDSQDLRIGNSLIFSVSADDLIPFNHIDAAGDRRNIGPVTTLAYRPHLIREHAVRCGKRSHLSIPVTQKTVLAPGGKPQVTLAVADGGANADAAEHLHKILCLKIDS